MSKLGQFIHFIRRDVDKIVQGCGYILSHGLDEDKRPQHMVATETGNVIIHTDCVNPSDEKVASFTDYAAKIDAIAKEATDKIMQIKNDADASIKALHDANLSQPMDIDMSFPEPEHKVSDETTPAAPGDDEITKEGQAAIDAEAAGNA